MTVVILVVLLSRLHLAGVLRMQRGSTLGLLGVALVVTAGGIGLSVLRWQRVLAALGMRTRIWALLGAHLAGMFVGNFLPSTVGGDALRAARVARITREKAGAVASVMLERLTGWIVLPVLTFAALLLNPGLLHLGSASHVALAVAVATLAALMVVVLVAGNGRTGRRLQRRAGWLGFAAALHLGLAGFRCRPREAVQVLAVSFAYQLMVALAAFLVADAMGLRVGWTAILAFMPVVAIVQVLPFTIGGLGLREGAFVLFLGPLGVSTSQAIAFGLLVYGLNLVVSLCGAPSFAAGAPAAPMVGADAAR